MLVLSRKAGESIVIGNDIKLKVIGVEGDTVKLGIDAPRSVKVHRKEVYDAIQEENKNASEISITLDALKQWKKPE